MVRSGKLSLRLLSCGLFQGCQIAHEDSRAIQGSNVFIHRQLGHDTDVLRLTFHDKTGQVRHMFHLLLHEPPHKVKNSLFMTIS